MKELLQNGICAHAAHLQSGDYSSADLTRACLEQMDARENDVGAFLTVDAEGALTAARESDARRARGECRGILDGIPFALKDNICARGLRLTCASRILENYIAPYDATVTARLKDAGAVLVGKTNMDEFAMGSTTGYSALGQTSNPWNPDCVPGGSSGGSAAAVGAREVPFALGSDTGGSVRQPAAFCGVYGLKPTYGAISRYGLASMASSLDCIGILAHSARDTAAVFSAIAGKDGYDATALDAPRIDLDKLLKPLRVGVVADFTKDRVSADVWEAMQRAIALLSDRGAVLEEVHLPMPEEALAAYSVISCAELSSNLSRYDGVHFGRRAAGATDLRTLYAASRGEGFGAEVKRRVLFGMDMLRAENRERYYVRAQRVRELILHKMTALSERYDLLLSPTAPTVAFEKGKTPPPASLYYADLCTVYASLAGFPALSIPFGFDGNGLPLAVQLTARPCAEELLLRTASVFEEGVR